MLKSFKTLLIFSSLLIFIFSAYERFYPANIEGKDIVYKTSYLIEEDTVLDEEDLTSNSLDDIALLIVGGAKVTIRPGRTISKKVSQENENLEKTDNYKYGLTSTIVAIGSGTKVIIEKAKINVDASFSNAIVALNGASIIIKNSTITTKKKYSKGIVILSDSSVDISGDSIIKTEGNYSPCLELNINKGYIEGSIFHLSSKGEGSPLLNTLGDGEIMLNEAKGTAENSQIMVVQGHNTISISNSNLNCKGINKENNNGGILLYKNNNDNRLVELESYNSQFSLINNPPEIPMFYCFNIEADITLDNTETKNGNVFIKAYQTDDSNINTKIHLTVNRMGFDWEIIALDEAKIILKDDSNLLANNKITGNVEMQ
jgi:hypothetical protein